MAEKHFAFRIFPFIFRPSTSDPQALAYTSKTPGKTQQFNYFVVNNNTDNAFYLVDMPGLGYAKARTDENLILSLHSPAYLLSRATLTMTRMTRSDDADRWGAAIQYITGRRHPL